ncbi:MAG: hypothetical protein PHI16_04370, partial [Methanocellales archaeon]|nr:hypothetical protein [Methanocellales archaeon]
MTMLLPSFNGNGTRRKSEIQICLDCRLTVVKRLAKRDPTFFLLTDGGLSRNGAKKRLKVSDCSLYYYHDKMYN